MSVKTIRWTFSLELKMFAKKEIGNFEEEVEKVGKELFSESLAVYRNFLHSNVLLCKDRLFTNGKE